LDATLFGFMKEGIFAALFIFLLWNQMQENKRQAIENKEREDKLMDFLTDMRGEFAKLVRQYEKLSEDVEEIKETVNKKSDGK
jgi:hypothetical protein